ncbi:MAG: hypothetical protein FWD01_04065, partial [Defluviitaleaceae bacterium]|nr:hypothetical protein [Defluviitaleaceae bacterium]
NNFFGDEFDLLSDIFLYPYSEESNPAMLGSYTPDIRTNNNGDLILGNNSYIEIFNMNRHRSVLDIAAILAHEYGHHYTISNIINYEGIHPDNWQYSEYAQLRNFDSWSDNQKDGDFERFWCIFEIAANDYVQLLGSQNARTSYAYMDTWEILQSGESRTIPMAFNAAPQENLQLPLAADVPGLFEYMMQIGGFSHSAPEILVRPEILGIDIKYSALGRQFAVNWSEAAGADETADFEYTAIAFPVGDMSDLRPLRTVNGNSYNAELSAIFGTVYIESEEGISAIFDEFHGEFVFMIFAKNSNGYIFSSERFYFDFGSEVAEVLEIDDSQVEQVEFEILEEISEFDRFTETANEGIFPEGFTVFTGAAEVAELTLFTEKPKEENYKLNTNTDTEFKDIYAPHIVFREEEPAPSEPDYRKTYF